MTAGRAVPLLLLVLPLGAEVVTYQIRPAPGNRLALDVAKTGLLSGKKHLFVFERYQGLLRYDRDAPERSRVEMTIESASIVCQDTWVKPKELQKITQTALQDMMAAEQHPRLVFSSTSIARQAESRFEVRGTLTIRGIAKPVVVAVTMTPGSGETLTFAGRAEVRMKDYGLKPPSAALGMVGTRNEMEVGFQLTAVAVR